MNRIFNLLRREPAAVVGLVVAILTLVVDFGVPINAHQKAAIVGVVGAVLTLLGAGVTRSLVTPVVKAHRRHRATKTQAGALTTLEGIGLAVLVVAVLILLAVLGILQ